jgi:hypothetical protein
MRPKTQMRVSVGIGFALGAAAMLAYHWLRLTGRA